jgi:hypothetical protein
MMKTSSHHANRMPQPNRYGFIDKLMRIVPRSSRCPLSNGQGQNSDGRVF